MTKSKMASTWAWVMHFKQLPPLLLVTCQLVVASCAVHIQGGAKVDVGDYEAIGPEQTLAVKGDVRLLCKDALGYEYPLGLIIYRRNNNTAAWQIATKGKHGLITSLFIIKEGQIIDCRVLSSKEVRGKQIAKKRYLKQFTGLSLLKPNKLSKRVDGISGATTSSKAMMHAAILALRLDGRQQK